MKISEDPEKSTVPGRKALYRLVDSEGEDQCHLSFTHCKHNLRQCEFVQ